MTVEQIIKAINQRVGRSIVSEYGEQFIVDTMNRKYNGINEEYGLVRLDWVIEKGEFRGTEISNTAVQINVSASANTFTRISGSFITDGFVIGDVVKAKGFSNAGNNKYYKVTVVAETVITVDGTDFDGLELVDETGSGDEVLTAPIKNYVFTPSDFIRPYKISDYKDHRTMDVFEDWESNTFSIDQERIYISEATDQTALTIKYFSDGKTLVSLQPGESLAAGQINIPKWPGYLHEFLIYATALDILADYPMRESDSFNYNSLLEKIVRHDSLKDASSPKLAGPGQRINRRVKDDPYWIQGD